VGNPDHRAMDTHSSERVVRGLRDVSTPVRGSHPSAACQEGARGGRERGGHTQGTPQQGGHARAGRGGAHAGYTPAEAHASEW